MAVRCLDVDGHANGCWELLYSRSGFDRQSDGLVKMVDELTELMDSLMDRVGWHTDGQTLTDGLTDRSQDGWVG